MSEQQRPRGLMMPPTGPDPSRRGLMAPPTPLPSAKPPRPLMWMDRPEGRRWMAPDPDLPELDGTELARLIIKTFTALTLALAFVLWYYEYAQAALLYLHRG